VSPLPYPRYYWPSDGGLVFRADEPGAFLTWSFYTERWEPPSGLSEQDRDYMQQISPARARKLIGGGDLEAAPIPKRPPLDLDAAQRLHEAGLTEDQMEI
jgi:hypothetical protein